MKNRDEFLKKAINRYLVKEQLTKNDENKKLKNSFLIKSRKNFSVGNILFKISDVENFKKRKV